MKKRSFKIGYAIASDLPLNIPAYRRRFGFYLRQRNISWEIADINKSYDLVVVHHSADITVWKDYDKAKIIFDYNDDYLSGIRHNIKDIGRGLAKYLYRHWSKLEFDYKKAYTKMMKRADAIVCCTDIQEQDARKYCNNVIQILDLQSDSDWIVKNKYDCGSTFNFVWEGLPGFEGLIALTPVLNPFQKKNNTALHLITALKHGKYLRNFFQIHTKDEISSKLKLENIYLYEWNPYLFSHIVAACDLAIIPIDMRIPFWVSKPANKLLFFWRIGMPTLVDAIPEYVKVMNKCGLDMVCNSPEEWEEKLNIYSKDREKRKFVGIKAKKFVDEYFGEYKILCLWDSIIASVL